MPIVKIGLKVILMFVDIYLKLLTTITIGPFKKILKISQRKKYAQYKTFKGKHNTLK